jgi:pyruvate kinase
MIETVREEIFQASLTGLVSDRSGQKRSKKKAEPKIVATDMPTKMLKEAIPTKSLF